MKAHPLYDRVVIVGVDGAGNFFRQAETPQVDRIFANGARTDWALTSEPTISAQCWGSMLIGVAPEVHLLTNSIVSAVPRDRESPFPSVFRVIREHDPDCDLAAFCNWSPIYRGIIEDNLGVTTGTGNDEAVTAQILDYLKEHSPKLLFVQFDEVDGAGHGHGYGTEKHLESITKADALIGKIYDAYDAKGELDGTLFIVDADHGGFGTGHGGSTDEEKYVMYAAAGKTVSHTEIQNMEIRDNAAVVLYALGYEQPETWTGRVPSGLFEGVEAGERPVYIPPVSEARVHETLPTPPLDEFRKLFDEERVLAFLPFDGDVSDAFGKTETEGHGKLYFIDGYYGSGMRTDDGYVTLKGIDLSQKSFSVAFWVKTDGIAGDPAVFSNKDWTYGGNPGFALFMDAGAVTLNLSDGKNRFDYGLVLPRDFRGGWVHVAAALDREAGELRMAADFGSTGHKVREEIPEEMRNASFAGVGTLNVGQDGTGHYRSLSAELDDFILLDGALTEEDLGKLASYYGA